MALENVVFLEENFGWLVSMLWSRTLKMAFLGKVPVSCARPTRQMELKCLNALMRHRYWGRGKVEMY